VSSYRKMLFGKMEEEGQSGKHILSLKEAIHGIGSRKEKRDH
jgi:hypothetical protein